MKVGLSDHLYTLIICMQDVQLWTMWGCLHEYCTVTAYILYVGVSGRWLWSCPGLFPALKRLEAKGLCGLHVSSFHLTCPAAIKSNHTQMKWARQASRASVGLSQPEENSLRFMPERFKSADLEALTQCGMATADLSQATLAQRKSFKGRKSSGSAKPWGISASASLSLSLSHSCLVPSETRQSELQAGTRLIAMNWN